MERNEKLKKQSQHLRKNQTKEESLLWYNFLRKYPHTFRRQYIIGSYIVDFYCHRAKLVVELDGSQHYFDQTVEYDKRRTAFLENLGLKVLRFANAEVLNNLRSVCEMIDMVVKDRIQHG